MRFRSLSFFLAATAVVGAATLASSRALFAGGAPSAPTTVKAELNAEALHALIGAGVPLTLLDARGASSEWIAGAKPCSANTSADDVHRLCPIKQGLIVTYCGGSSCNASLELANRLLEDGYGNVIRFTGGIEGWSAAGFELKRREIPAPPAPVEPAPRGGGSGSR